VYFATGEVSQCNIEEFFIIGKGLFDAVAFGDVIFAGIKKECAWVILIKGSISSN